ncbi:MAG: DNA-deoxyinosine glycosylase [Dechloromonas sp.]|nr:MAG: DNA-deoxyinosine glycosylase [Dechloromonas sp.]
MTGHARGFPPIAAPGARILILGSMPGQASLAAGQYYAHPRNAFWPIMGALLGFAPALPYPERAVRLAAAGVALWDVLHACTRPGSLDTAIDRDSAEPNDFAAFFAAQPGIRHVFFNGSAAAALFRRHDQLPPGAAGTRLPSTSPAHAGRNFADKLAAWQAVADALAGCGRRG